MKLTYKYIHFVKTKDLPKTSVYSCRNKRSSIELGTVKWHGPWRQYCYFPTIQAVHNIGYLKDITNFIELLTVKEEKLWNSTLVCLALCLVL